MALGKFAASVLCASAMSVLVAACAKAPSVPPPAAALTTATNDAATRSTPVVPGRRSRVFIFASLGPACEPTAAPRLDITTPPAKGDVSFVPGQQTTLVASATGQCAGRPATGTGVYYTAREGATGGDRFTVDARAADGRTLSRTFDVKITE